MSRSTRRVGVRAGTPSSPCPRRASSTPSATHRPARGEGGDPGGGDTYTTTPATTMEGPPRKVMPALLLLFLLALLLQVRTSKGAMGGGRRRRQSEILHCQILEELPAGTLVGNIITDARLNLKYNGSELSKLRFSFLTQPDLDKEYFAIETATGIITTLDRIDRDKLCPQVSQCFVKFDVAVRPVKNFQIIKVTVEVQDVNDNSPFFPQSRITHQISESTLPGTSFSIPAATDPDSSANGVQRYELVSSSNKFELKVRETADGATDLRLVLMDELDRELVDFYQVKILAHDGGEPAKSGSVLIDISVLDANDNDPIFENSTYEVSVRENVPIGTTIFRVRAKDPDKGSNGEIVYQLSRHTQQNYGDLFDIDSTTGEIFVKGPLDYEDGAIYLLSVTAFDSGPDSLPAHATVVVRVQDMNDNAPQITVNTLTTSGDAQVAENTPPGTFVAHISIVDGDSDKNGKFTCSLSDSHFHLQKLYLTEYKIVTSAIFDRERLPYFDLTLECRDRGIPAQKSFAHIRVTILDDNDHTPAFSQPMYTATIIENNLIGEFIVAVTANDQDIDTNGRIKYELDEDARGLVAIDEDTGSITANVIFDHEDLSELQFHVIAKDQGTIPRSTSAKVLISIVDIDDEIPRFQQETYAFGTFENQPINTEVGQVVAEDRDSEPYNHFSYSLHPGRGTGDIFRIDPHTGKISTLQVLDREEKPVYYMVVVASSDEDFSQSSTVSVSVYVADKNDNSPVFDFPSAKNNSLRISNKVPVGQVITRLRAHDADSGKNARLNYLITTGNSNNAFAIDPSTGAISVNKELEANDGDSFMLQVIVQDQGEPLLSALGELNIYVTKVAGYAKSRSMNLSKDNLIIVIVFVVVTAIISMIIIATIVIIKRRDTEQRHNDENSKKELQRMLPPMEDVNGAPGSKVKASNPYVTAVEMDNLKSKNLPGGGGGGGGENGNASKASQQQQSNAPNVNNRQRQEEVQSSANEKPPAPAPPPVAPDPPDHPTDHHPTDHDPPMSTAAIDDDLPPPPDSWRFSLGWASSTPCPSPVETPRHPPGVHPHPHPHHTSTTASSTSSSTLPRPSHHNTTLPTSTTTSSLPDHYSSMPRQHKQQQQQQPSVDTPSWGLPDLADDLEVSIAIRPLRGGSGPGGGGPPGAGQEEEDAGSDHTTSSNSDSGRGPSSVEGDPNTHHKLSIDGLEDNSTAAKQRLLQGPQTVSSHFSRPPTTRRQQPPSPTHGAYLPGSASHTSLTSSTPTTHRRNSRPNSPCKQPPDGPGSRLVSPTSLGGSRLTSPSGQRIPTSPSGQRLPTSPSGGHQQQQRLDLLPSPVGVSSGGQRPLLSPCGPRPDTHTLYVGAPLPPKVAPKPSPMHGAAMGRQPNKMVTFGDQPEVFDEMENAAAAAAAAASAALRRYPGGGAANTLPHLTAQAPQPKQPMRIQRQYPPAFRPQQHPQAAGAPPQYPPDCIGGSSGMMGDGEPPADLLRERPRGAEDPSDTSGDYVVYSYDDADTRETNV